MTMAEGLTQQPDPRVIVVQQPQPTTPPTPPQPETYTREQLLEFVENARKEEKDKLYETINSMDERVRSFEEERQRITDEAEQARIAAEEAERQKQQGDLTALERLEAKEQEWSQRFEQQQQAIDAQAAIAEQERQYQALVLYRNQRINELSDQIDPRFLDFVGGNSPDEIEASLYVAIDKTSQISQEIQEYLGQQQPQQQQPAQRVPGMPVTSGPGFTPEQFTNNPMEKTYTPEDIAALSPQDYAANREALMAAASAQIREKGLYTQ